MQVRITLQIVAVVKREEDVEPWDASELQDSLEDEVGIVLGDIDAIADGDYTVEEINATRVIKVAK